MNSRTWSDSTRTNPGRPYQRKTNRNIRTTVRTLNENRETSETTAVQPNDRSVGYVADNYRFRTHPAYVPNSDLEPNIAATRHKRCYTLLLWPKHHEP